MESGIIALTFNKRTAQLPAGGTLGQLADAAAAEFGVGRETIKLLLPHGKLVLPASQPNVPLAGAGITPGAKIRMLASSAMAVAGVQAQREAPGLPSFDHELERELRRKGALQGASASKAQGPPSGQYAFQRFEPWQRPGLSPPPSEALKLLHRLASDPGIVGILQRHCWSVGLLSEMSPEGKVGVSPVCILGVNINRGQEISLRLRTDDLKGFRRYDRILETLLHELAHMVHGEHDDAFKTLNSQLRRECEELGWPGGHALLGAPAYQGTLRYDLPAQPQGAMAATAVSSGHTLRELAGIGGTGSTHSTSISAHAANPRAAAAAAAARRAAQPERQPVAGSLRDEPAAAAARADGRQQQQQQQQEQHPQQGGERRYVKGDCVLYRQRDGSLVHATVVAVDHSVQPPSYGIELPGSGHRETEAARLQAPPPGTGAAGTGIGVPGGEQEEEQVEGLGHRDAATEAKEAAVRAMEA